MTDKIKKTTSFLLLTSATAVGCVIIWRNRTRILRLFGDRLQAHRHPLEKLNYQIVETHEECLQVVKKLSKECKKYPILGFDCEWLAWNPPTPKGRHKVSLLQLSSYSGFCALIRLNKLGHINHELRELLENEDILKIGVACGDDAEKLSYDFAVGVACTMDLRYLAFEVSKIHENLKPGGLANMAQNMLNVHLDKDRRVVLSNWERDALKPTQIEYAAKDAIVAIELFKFMANAIEPKPKTMTEEDYVKEIIENYCRKYMDLHYKEFNFGPSRLPVASCAKKEKVAQKVKLYTGSVRQKPLYDNCIMQAPDGEILCTCDRTKAEWYIEKGLGKLITEDPFTFQLTFEPAGRAVDSVGKYYTMPKENRCVVCGKEEDLIRKNVVPREYRKFFPEVMKDHTSHDILLLCTLCHQISNMTDLRLRNKLGRLCEAPIQSQTNVKLVEVPSLKKMKSAARALLRNGMKIPAERKKVLEEEFLSYFPEGTQLTEELLAEYENIDTHQENESYYQHGKIVVEYFMKNGGIIKLEKMWREHFMSSMKPKFLPDLWSVDHNEKRLEIRADEGRVEKSDLIVAGVDKEIEPKSK